MYSLLRILQQNLWVLFGKIPEISVSGSFFAIVNSIFVHIISPVA